MGGDDRGLKSPKRKGSIFSEMTAFRRCQNLLHKKNSRAEKKTTALKTSTKGALSRRERAVSTRSLEIITGKVGRTHGVKVVEITH